MGQYKNSLKIKKKITGSCSVVAGFTLVEVLLAVMILSFSATYIFGAFFNSVSAVNQAESRLLILGDLNNVLCEMKREIAKDSFRMPFAGEESFRMNNRTFHRKIQVYDTETGQDLCYIDLHYFWFEGKKKITINRKFVWFYKKGNLV